MESKVGDSLAVQGQGLCTLTAEGLRSIPGQGTKIHESRGSMAKRKKKNPKELNCEPMWESSLWLQVGREDQCIF